MYMYEFLCVYYFHRHRAACIDNYVQVLCDLHKQFHWPFPPSSLSTTPSSSTSTTHTTREPSLAGNTDNINPIHYHHRKVSNEREDSLENSLSKMGIKRLNRPPDLNISGGVNSMVQVVEAKVNNERGMGSEGEEEIQEVIVQSSTPSRGSYSFTSDNIMPTQLPSCKLHMYLMSRDYILYIYS